ncbi:DUF6344 domain-containing protein [Streptomyces sp. NPDC059785]|uniref:DUF6344 domain-containing protein n=1 Tax=unclassified Streptomyces TaxID=2593676 RepID=UPI00365747EA
MAQNKVMTLWTTIVTAFLALCTALGLITTASASPVPQTETPRNSSSDSDSSRDSGASLPAQTTPYWSWSYSRSLPPTMKQRIRAEAHGSSPSCRHRPPSDDTSAEAAAPCDDSRTTDEADPEVLTPLQR